MTPPDDPQRQFLRHTVATLAYRGGKTLRDAFAGFGDFRLQEGSRSPLEILAHVGDLFDWAVALSHGKHVWRDAELGTWEAQVERFFEGLRRFDEALASPEPLGFPAEAVSGTDRRRLHPCRPDRHAPPPGRRAGARRELLQGRHPGWAGWTGAGCPAGRIRLKWKGRHKACPYGPVRPIRLPPHVRHQLLPRAQDARLQAVGGHEVLDGDGEALGDADEGVAAADFVGLRLDGGRGVDGELLAGLELAAR